MRNYLIIFWLTFWVLNFRISSCDDAVIESDKLPILADMPTLANGHLGFVIYGDSILMNGLYNGIRGESHRARIPNFANLVTSIKCTSNCAYQLNMRKGYFQNTLNNGSNYHVNQQLYAHRFYNRAIINSFTLIREEQTGNIATELSISPGDAESVDLNKLTAENVVIVGREVIINCYETYLIEDTRYQKDPSKVCIGYTSPPKELTLMNDENLKEFLHITAVARTKNEVVNEFSDIFEAIDSSTNILERHTSIWESHWKRFGISVEGNSRINQIIHSSMFYLISSLPSEETNQPKDPFYGLSPGGIPKGGVVYMEYQGHSFWDTEIWMHPPILLLNPKWSEEILKYRYNVKIAAADNARNTKYNGYRYPWESGFTGCEVTPDCCPEVVEFQHHVISDIAFAFRSHLAASRDVVWWNQYGCDIAFNTARFWESRVNFNESTRFYDIRNVMGPDEDHHNIDNNVYTNVNAAINLYFGDFAACHCKDVLNVSFADYERFGKIAQSLKLLYDEKYDFHPQFEGYKGEQIKQADAILLGYPLQLPMNASTKRNDLELYDNKTRENGPAMTWSMHTIGFLDLQDEVTAGKYFEKSFSLYTREPFNTWSEAIPGQPAAGNFITGAGGFLQSVINGYGGIRLNFVDMVITKGYLPPGCTKLTLNGITYLDNEFSLEVNSTFKIMALLRKSSQHAINVIIDGENRGDFGNFMSANPLIISKDSEITLKPAYSFGESESCEMKETIVGKQIQHQPVPFIDNEWILGSNYLPDFYELPALSNGHIGLVIYGDSIFMNGLYNGAKGSSHRARIPNFSNIVTNLGCLEQNCAYQLHLKDGYFETISYSGNKFKVTQQMYAHRFYNRAIVNKFVIERLEGLLEEPLSLTLSPGKEESGDLRLLKMVQYMLGTKVIVMRCYETIIIEDAIYQKNLSTICISHTNVPSHLVISSTQTTTEYVHFTVVAKNEEEVRKEMADILNESYTILFNKHKSAWQDDMNKYEMTVDDNKELNQVLHSSLFYLISNLPSEYTNQPNGRFYGLSPSGLAKGADDKNYNGHSFWDTEMWMHPPLLLLNPFWSEEILKYRYHARKAAEDYAKYTTFKGYRFPWESGFTGCEVTPGWAWEVIEYQHHIVADIAFAFRSHLAATHDISWWNQYGCDIAYNTAKFWQSRANFNESTRFYDIKNIMGPDEDHYGIDNNVYTNVNAAMNLYLGDFAWCTCKSILDISDAEFENFGKIAKSIKLIYDENNDYHPQYEGYKGDLIKQADVVLIGYPLQFPMNDSTKRNNLLIYDNVTRSTGPAMTWSMHTIGFLDIQDQVGAAKMFERSYSVYTHEPFKTWSENQPGIEGSGNFITGVGGFLQSVLNGYGGIRLHFDYLSITNFYNPPNTKGLNLKGITYLNNSFNLEIKDDQATVVITEVSKEHLIKITLMPANTEYEAKAGQSIKIKRNEELIMKSEINPFGTCEMKKTVLGISTAVMLKVNIFVIFILTMISVNLIL